MTSATSRKKAIKTQLKLRVPYNGQLPKTMYQKWHIRLQMVIWPRQSKARLHYRKYHLNQNLAAFTFFWILYWTHAWTLCKDKMNSMRSLMLLVLLTLMKSNSKWIKSGSKTVYSTSNKPCLPSIWSVSWLIHCRSSILLAFIKWLTTMEGNQA